jgi:PAS domain S-box-containing protein
MPTLLGALFGLLFPVSTVLFMLHNESQAFNRDNIASLHLVHYDLFILWTAPLVLAIFGGFIGTVTRKLKLEMHELQSRTTQLNTVLDTAASAIITMDSQGTILSFNHSAEDIFGISADEIIGKTVNHLMPDDLPNQRDSDLQHYLQGQSADASKQPRETTGKRKNGEIFPILLRLRPMIMEGKLFFAGMIDDISETKLLHSQLEQAQKLEAIGQLASGVAHEINTPIQYVGDNLAALADNFADIATYQAELLNLIDENFKPTLVALADKFDLPYILTDSPKAISQAQDGVARVTEIVKAMKIFSHVGIDESKQVIDLHEALDSALTITRGTYKNIARIETDYADDVNSLECYANELNQVFLNLIVNAAQAIEERQTGSGLIKIITRKRGDNTVEILIQDNGPGIPQAIQEKVFNLFFTTKPVGKGTGQGLSLAHAIVVEKHRGKLYFESRPESGTTFHIELPLTGAAAGRLDD